MQYKNKIKQNLKLQEQMTKHSNEVLKIKVYSVALPTNFNPELRTKVQFLDWLQKKIFNKYSYAYEVQS
jgi:hypothetical protein